jgi:hypothetical protein
MRRPAATLNRSGSRSSARTSLTATVPRKKPEQIPLIDRADEPEARKDEWLLDRPREGPGTMHRDAYACWRYLLELARLQSQLERSLLQDKDWDVMRSGRAVKRAIEAGWVMAKSVSRTDSTGKVVPDWMLTARPEAA